MQCMCEERRGGAKSQVPDRVWDPISFVLADDELDLGKSRAYRTIQGAQVSCVTCTTQDDIVNICQHEADIDSGGRKEGSMVQGIKIMMERKMQGDSSTHDLPARMGCNAIWRLFGTLCMQSRQSIGTEKTCEQIALALATKAKWKAGSPSGAKST